MGFSLIDLSGKKFKELNFKWIIFTEQPQKNANIINFQKKFNGVIKKYLDKYITTALCEEFLLALDNIFMENAELLKEYSSSEVLLAACKVKDKLYSLYNALTRPSTPHEEAKETIEKNSTSTEGTLDITSLRGFPEFDIKIFVQWSKTTVLSGFEVWFKKAVKPMVKIIKHDYAANDIRREDTSTWDEQIWLYHTGFLMLCDLNDEDLRSWAESVWKKWLDDGEERFSHIKQILQVVLWGLAEEPDKDYVISRTSHDAIPRKEQEKMEEETEKTDSERGLDLNFLN